MNFVSSIGGISLMVLAVVWLAVFLPQWARQSEERGTGAVRKSNQLAQAATERLNPLEIQMLRLTHTRNRMGTLAATLGFAWVGVVFLTSGTFLAFLAWPIGLLAIGAAALALAASRRLTTLAVGNSGRKAQRLGSMAHAPAINLKAEPLPQRSWQPTTIPQPIRQRPVGEVVVRGAKVVPLIDSVPERKIETKTAPEIQSAQIDEILRRRRAN